MILYYIGNVLKEALIKSRLTAWHAICLHIFRHITQILLDLRQQACVGFRQSDEKSDCASCAPDLISASLKRIRKRKSLPARRESGTDNAAL
jgi:hypothetical protein